MRAKEGKTSKFNNLSVMTGELFISILRPQACASPYK